MNRAEQLKQILENLQAGSSDIEACAVVSEDGLMIASLLPQGLEEAQVAAMSAEMMSLGTRTAKELNRGSLQQFFIKGDNGYAIGMDAGPHAVLLVLARKEARLGLIFLDLSRAAEETNKALA
ncbi:MAG: roadblock/LC7 domain-containing protein [Candidatus Aminicenantes bacterium]|nr:MAG: roadblock/LC7 domain-containing protein [Candidatus Aminicenantes bacterium]